MVANTDIVKCVSAATLSICLGADDRQMTLEDLF